MSFIGLRLGNEPEMGRADIQSLASLAEELGYGEVWMTEGVGRDSLTQLTAIATASGRIHLGTGILPMFWVQPLWSMMFRLTSPPVWAPRLS